MTTRRYAEGTKVPASRTRAEIEDLLKAHGATAFGYFSRDDAELITFELQGRRIRFVMPLPDPNGTDICFTEYGKQRGEAARRAALEQAVKQRWRAFLLIVKAKLEAIAAGVVSAEDEFLPWTIIPTPGGQSATVSEWLEPQVREAYRTGAVPALLAGIDLPALGSGR